MHLFPSLVLVAQVYGAEPASFYFQLGNTIDAYLEYEHSITYAVLPKPAASAGQACKVAFQISAPFHDDRAVRENQCFLKCKIDPMAPGCAYAGNPAYEDICKGAKTADTHCFSGSNTLCVETEQDMADLCSSVAGCDSYTFRSYKSGKLELFGGELNMIGCRPPSTGKYNLNWDSKSGGIYFRTPGYSMEECPLGLGVEITGGPWDVMKGLYAADTSEYPVRRYTQVGAGKMNYISWHTSGCGWTGLAFDQTFATTPVVPSCSDDDVLANYLFSQCSDFATCSVSDPDYHADICMTITTIWGGDYCKNDIFAMVCPNACKADCTADNNNAGAQLLAMLGTETSKVDEACDDLIMEYVGCKTTGAHESWVYKVLEDSCPAAFKTCVATGYELPARRLQERGPIDATTLRRNMGRSFSDARRLGYDFALPDLPTGVTGSFSEVFYTFESTACGGSSTPLEYMLNTKEVYDVPTFHEKIPGFDMVYECESVTTYATAFSGKYCQHNNVAVPYNDDPEIVENGCQRKCESRAGALRYTDSMDDGTNTWCSGNHRNFTVDTNALCVPREECERLCTKTAGCASFDMHASLPRCYLNTMACGAYDKSSKVFASNPDLYMASDDYSTVYQKTTPTETEAPGEAGDAMRIYFKTMTGVDCRGATGPVFSTSPTAPTTRKACEALCESKDTCTHFAMEMGYCKLYGEDFIPSTCTDALEKASEFVLVEKVTPMSCRATLTQSGVESTLWRIVEDELLDDYNETRLVYVSTDTSTAECDGWKYETNVAEPVPITFENCTDHVEAARVWLPDYMLSAHFDAWKEDYISRYPELPCEDRDSDASLQYFLGVDEATFLANTDNKGCKYLFENLTNSYAAIDLHYDLSEATRDVYNASGVYQRTVSRLKYMDTLLVKKGTSVCTICCGTIYKMGGTCNADIRANSTYAHSEKEGVYLSYHNETYLPVPERAFEFPCQFGADEGLCTNPTFHGLCPHTCAPLIFTHIGKSTYSAQDLTLYGDTLATRESGSNSSCEADWDNNLAMHTFRLANLTWNADDKSGKYTDLMNSLNALQACAQSVGEDPYACVDKEYTPIVVALCPSACARAVFPAGPPPPAPPPDEADVEGSPQRRLYTTSYTGPPRGEYSTFKTEFYKPYERASWKTTAHTWVNGSSSILSAVTGAHWDSMGTFNEGDPAMVCNNLDDDIVKRFGVITTDKVYSTSLNKVSMSITPICRKTSVCPALTTCVLTEQRFQDEMKLWRKSTYVGRGQFISELDSATRGIVLGMGDFAPKVLISADRAEALIDSSKTAFAHSIYRSVPLATRVLPSADSVYGDKTIISLVPALDTPVLSQELGRTYDDPSGGLLEKWRSDVIRIERFNSDGTPLTNGKFSFKLTIPSVEKEKIIVYRYGPVMFDPPVDIEEEGGSVTRLSDGSWMVTVVSVNSDFVATEDVDDCASNPCEAGEGDEYTVDAICTNHFNKPYTCSCPPGYSGSGYKTRGPVKGSPCTIGSVTYEPAGRSETEPPREAQDFYLRIRHTDRLDYGWRLNEIVLYETAQCTGSIDFGKSSLGLPGFTSGMTAELITDETGIYTGEYGNAFYPHESDDTEKKSFTYSNANLFDGKTNNEWRSACLNCNPEEVDKTHNGPVEIVIALKGDVPLNCIGFFQVEKHHSSSIVVEMGPVKGDKCGMAPDLPFCKPTMTWSKSGLPAVPSSEKDPDDKSKVILNGFMQTTCGLEDTMYYGELLVFPGTEKSGHYSSIGAKAQYGNTLFVPTACHCQALCIANLGYECRSYVYDTTSVGTGKGGKGHCFLQTNKFEEATSSPEGAFADKTSGTPSLRVGTYMENVLKVSESPYLTGFELGGTPGDGTTFSLTVNGVGLPWAKAKAADTSDFQRVKIIKKGSSCASAVPIEVEGIGCAESTRVSPTAAGATRETTVFTICAPRPDPGSTALSATWSGLKITAAEVTTTYEVCYCSGNCFAPSSWELVPGSFDVSMATFSWATVGDKIYRKTEGQKYGSLSLSVKRPPFGTFSDAKTWELKVIRDHFDCSTAPSTKFLCVDGLVDSMDTKAPSVVANFTMNNGGLKLVFDEEVTKDNCDGNFTILHDLADMLVPCADTWVYGNAVWINPPSTITGDAFLLWDADSVFDLHGNGVAAMGGAGFAVTGVASGADAYVVGTEPHAGTSFFKKTVIVAFDQAMTAMDDVVLTDCGSDAVCGTDDDFEEDVESATLTNAAQILEVNAVNFMQGHVYELSITNPDMAFSFEFTYGCPYPNLVTGPDTASWSYKLEIGATETGSYQVCFREGPEDTFTLIPSSSGQKYIDILKIDADSTTPRGVFHNQHFSALSGASFVSSFTVAGTRLPVPSDSKVVLTSGACGAAGSFFEGTVRGKASTDTDAPTLKSGHYPGNGDTVGKLYAMKLEFSEPITTVGCFGNISIIGGSTTTIACTDVTTSGKYAIIEFSGLPDSLYSFELDTGSFLDLAGNVLTYVNTGATYSFDVSDGGATAAPEVVMTSPRNGGALVNGTGNASEITITFSVDVTGATGVFLVLTDCGSDYVCDPTDIALYRWAASDLTSSNGTVSVDVSVLGSTYGRWKLSVPAAAFAWSGQDSAEFAIEFVNDRTGFDYANVLTANAESTADGLVFDVILGNSTPVGTYAVCYCDDQSDDTLDNLGDGETTYALADDRKLTGVSSGSLAAVTIAGKTLAEHECAAKCSTGCVGPSCYCDGYVGAARDDDSYLCLPPSLCRQACGDDPSCIGISVHDTLPQCILADSGNATVAEVAETWQFFTKRSGTACTQLHDFATSVGSFAVTGRAHVGVDYVVTPGEPASIEVTAANDAKLTYEKSKYLLSEDRITIIDSLGQCGLSSPSSSVELNGPANITHWSRLAPWSYFQEDPYMDLPGAGPNQPDPAKIIDAYAPAASRTYNAREPTEDIPSVFCPGNMDLDEIKIPLAGVMVDVKEHQCYTKCGLNAPCTGDNCFCSGYYSGYDDITSNAICGNQNFCQYICDNTPGCQSIDMHRDLDRCFLNDYTCDLHQDMLGKELDKSYDLLIKTSDPNDERRLSHGMDAAPHTVDQYSWDAMLRFKGMKFLNGGTFKVCFCDSALLPEGATCSSEKDFSIQVGTVHASGVSCLLAKESLRRVNCVEQLYDGLRCYGSYPAPMPALALEKVSFE
jgi:hypothetical protein